MSGGSREHYSDSSARAFGAGKFDLRAMIREHPFAQVEAQARPFGLGCEKSGSDIIKDLFGHAGAGIANGKSSAAAFFRNKCPDEELSPRGHGVDGIHQEAVDDGPHAVGIEHDLGDFPVILVDFDALLFKELSNELDRILKYLVDGAFPELVFSHFSEIEEGLDGEAGMLGVAKDHVEIFAVGRILGQVA